ncbi:MAG: hypothetical protein JL50_04365 [Peptococcaceae bacterium BICA1-7]|nr:MAG: hypothetical protein JL50_04365 [Peptococcaceae bacterium BICA1-7]HBV95856.1 hypothetical protein [Desulfotomaculum sp.]
MLILLALLGFALVIWLEAPGLVKKKMWRELIAFSVYMAFALAISIPLLYGVRPFDANAPIEAVYKPLAKWLEKP